MREDGRDKQYTDEDQARRELAAPEGRTKRLRALERDREALLKDYAEMMPKP